ncbi:glycoside hydrolase [Rhypophila decipiens]|uniref:lytic cellulose monooxygenase (C4-dehydrogenating) n=1 Tax=Rhypophila decipiens TaxID=261697 RepID=A0AAN6XSL4_9PEZI|nr:glycoside hydrolase [Rhypophila decipiens]
MKLSAAVLTGVAVFASGVAAHQVHGMLLVNGTESPRWKYVRDVASQWPYGPWDYPEGSDFPKTPPQTDIYSTNITCGRLAFASAATTETADVLAGSEVGFRVSWDGDGEYGVFWHQGPAQIYLSRAPNDDITNYAGDGDWFKIAYAGPVNNNKWLLWPNEHEWNFTIPKTTPPGKYLMRIEQFMATYVPDYTQWYVNCAQINIIGPGGGTPTGFARFPGTYDNKDPGIFVPKNQWVNGGAVPDDEMRLLEYKAPGPAVWTGE